SPVEVGTDSQNNPLLLPSCSSTNGDAVPGVRLSQFVRAFGDNGAVASICQNDFGATLQQFGELVTTAMVSQCVRAHLPDARATGGIVVQGEPTGLAVTCTVVDSVSGFETPLPVCN